MISRFRDRIKSLKHPTIIHHYDADGISAAAILEMFLEELGKSVDTLSLKVLDENAISQIRDIPEKILVDFGTNYGDQIKDALIIDHHTPVKKFSNVINAHYLGIDGSKELSTSGLVSLITKDKEEIALIGATGDRQLFIGKNKELLERAIKKGTIKVKEDITLFGKRNRPIHIMLTYAFPDFLLSPKQVFSFLKKLQIPLKKGNTWRTYEDLSEDEKIILRSAIVEKALFMWGVDKIRDVYGENYILSYWNYDLKELTTIVNATGRQGKARIGLEICKGNSNALKEGLELLKKHQKEVGKGLRFAEDHLEDYGNFYLLDGRGKIPDSIIGVVISILEKDYNKPLIGIAEDGEKIKLSMRGQAIHVGKLIESTLNEIKKGEGGGHEKAGGAHIDKNDLWDFLNILNKKLHK